VIDLIHASAGAGKQGTCSESCFLIFLQEKEHGKWGQKGKENEEKRNSLKESATKHQTASRHGDQTRNWIPANGMQQTDIKVTLFS